MPTVVLGVTGCIGAYKACEVLRELQRRDVDVHVVMTEHATRFVGAMTFEALSRHPVFIDQFALGAESEIRHVSLADAADLLLVAPATANVLGKFARGIADDALTTLFLGTTAPVLVAPAMNVNMFRHPVVVENLEMLRSRGVGVVEPGTGYLACGWLGEGRLAEVPDIVDAAMAALSRRRSLAGETVVVTAGPTVEDIDPVRFISNRSSGRMGYRLAEVARDRGATVVLVTGPTVLPAPRGMEVVAVRSAEEMARAVAEKAPGAGIVAMAAAVSDYRPAAVAPGKIKKQDGAQKLDLVRTTDILESLGEAKGTRFLIGFAAETDDLVENARKKRMAKRVDLMVANDVSRNGAGFASEKNAAVLIDAKGQTDLPLMSKRELAERIWDRVAELRARA
ncbi:MAG: bifunctional phosphopantothenoylcysteine decarboxylase/phosphopantothenate--cysteine ligase CoaBC [Acidobacteria bacterium]|nr:MAG: bifunctional phosphopantothenoylcysteine decarboxylase/phosphopantothenate--cysteine ligase CoaBC [Acidobacteriota bacterium]